MAVRGAGKEKDSDVRRVGRRYRRRRGAFSHRRRQESEIKADIARRLKPETTPPQLPNLTVVAMSVYSLPPVTNLFRRQDNFVKVRQRRFRHRS